MSVSYSWLHLSADSKYAKIERCLSSYRSNCPRALCKKGVFENLAKFSGKHLFHSLFINKVAGLRSSTLLKRRLWHRCFPVNFAKFLRTPFFIQHLWWLLLFVIYLFVKWGSMKHLGLINKIHPNLRGTYRSGCL